MSLQAASLFNVDGLVAVVTGGSSGIGSYIAHALAENGAKKVYITGRRGDKLRQVAAKYPDIITALEGDVTVNADLERAAAHVRAETGYINLLVANAGTNDRSARDMGGKPSVETLQSFLTSLPEADWNRVLNVNVAAPMYTVAHFLDLLEAGNRAKNVVMSSQVVAMGSVAAYLRTAPLGGFAYSASKAGLTHLFKVLSTVLAPHRIRANIIAPGLYHSEMTETVLNAMKNEQQADRSGPRVPDSGVGQPEDMAGVILFLASRAGALCNGNVLVTDGGTISMNPAEY